MSKIFADARAALDGVLSDGMTIMSGGFGLTGNPEHLIPAIRDSGVVNLTVISNNCGAEGFGLWMLLKSRQIDKVICSYIGNNRLFADRYLEEDIRVELNPQGTLAERIRAGGAGIPAFYTRSGVGTAAAEGKQHEDFDGLTYIQERWLRADLAIVKAWKADPEGNLIFRKSARNFNPDMATAATITIAEVEEVVPLGYIDPDQVHTPGIFVDRVIQGHHYSGAVEYRTTRLREHI